MTWRMVYMPQSLFSFPQISFAVVEDINSSCKAGINGLKKAFRNQSAIDCKANTSRIFT